MPCALAFAALLLLSAIRSGGAEEPRVDILEDLTEGYGPASGARVAALDAGELTVAWCVPDGPGAGVYARRRSDYLWDSQPIRVAEAVVDPRDLALAYDREERVHLVWTAMQEQTRRLFHASLSGEGIDVAPHPINPGDEAGADYPRIASLDDGRMLMVWQASHLTDFAIESVLWDVASRTLTRLPSVSGASDAAMTPQILKSAPPVVCWYEILEKSNDVRFSRLDGQTQTWERIQPDGIYPWLPFHLQPQIVMAGEDSPYAVWHDEGPDGESSIWIARAESPEAETLGVEVFNQPPGDHRLPQLERAADDRLTLVWRVYDGQREAIRLAAVRWAEGETSTTTISPESHRFATDPWHVSQETWSVAVWVDDRRDGGSGAVGFAEVDWPR